MESQSTTTRSERNITKRLGGWAIVIVMVLLVPLMTRAPWTGSDYVFATVVLALCAVTYEKMTQNMHSKQQRNAVGATILLFILLGIGWAASGP